MSKTADGVIMQTALIDVFVAVFILQSKAYLVCPP